MSAAKKIQEKAEIVVREFVNELSTEEKQKVLQWSERALVIREDRSLTRVQKVKALTEIPNYEVVKVLLAKVFEALRKKVWTNQSWARRLGFVGLGAGISFGGAAVGIATMGAGIGVPLMLMTAAGGVVLGAAIDEIKKEL